MLPSVTEIWPASSGKVRIRLVAPNSGRATRNSFSTTMSHATSAPNITRRLRLASNGPACCVITRKRDISRRASSRLSTETSTLAPAYSASPTYALSSTAPVSISASDTLPTMLATEATSSAATATQPRTRIAPCDGSGPGALVPALRRQQQPDQRGRRDQRDAERIEPVVQRLVEQQDAQAVQQVQRGAEIGPAPQHLEHAVRQQAQHRHQRQQQRHLVHHQRRVREEERHADRRSAAARPRADGAAPWRPPAWPVPW